MLIADLLLKNNSLSTAYNFGPNQDSEKTVSSLIEEMSKSFEMPSMEFEAIAWEEAKYLKLNSDLARRELSWEPKINFSDAVAMTSEWYLAQMKGDSLWDVSNDQVSRFLALY